MLLTALIPSVFRSASLLIVGITKDHTGAVLPGCTVKLFRTSDDVYVASAISNAVGRYVLSTSGDNGPYYVVAYLAGSPDVAGTTLNTLMPQS